MDRYVTFNALATGAAPCTRLASRCHRVSAFHGSQARPPRAISGYDAAVEHLNSTGPQGLR